MLGMGQKALEKKTIARLRSIPRHARSERLRTMRWYRRQSMALALKRARLELAVRKAMPPAFLMLLATSALTLAIACAVKWLRA